MKHLIRDFWTLFTLLSICFATHAQRPWEVVKWSAEITGTKPNAPSAKLSATIMDAWHVYALSQPDGGPKPLKISIPSGSSLMLSGPIAENKSGSRF